MRLLQQGREKTAWGFRQRFAPFLTPQKCGKRGAEDSVLKVSAEYSHALLAPRPWLGPLLAAAHSDSMTDQGADSEAEAGVSLLRAVVIKKQRPINMH